MHVKTITGVTGDQTFGPLMLRTVRVAGTAALAGAVVIKQGATVLETLAVATPVGTERDFDDALFDANGGGLLVINIANAGDSIEFTYN